MPARATLTWFFGQDFILNFTLLILKKRFTYVFLERRREGERVRETSMCGCLSSASSWGPGPQSRCVPWLGIQPAALILNFKISKWPRILEVTSTEVFSVCYLTSKLTWCCITILGSPLFGATNIMRFVNSAYKVDKCNDNNLCLVYLSFRSFNSLSIMLKVIPGV